MELDIMQHSEAKALFEKEVLPTLTSCSSCGHNDVETNEEWANFVDGLRANGDITEEQQDNWDNPY